jgi:hypothetical protein
MGREVAANFHAGFKGKTINWYRNQYFKNNKQQNGFKDTIN